MRDPVSEPADDPRWGQQDRDTKAHAIAQTLRHHMSLPLDQVDCADIGCGSGGIAFHLAPLVRSIVGVDPESWQRWKDFEDQRKNLHFLQESVERLSIPDASIDVVICNQVYEHVPDPRRLIREIHRVLKPGGYCYFAGPNLLFPIEPHIFWPFVHWLPRPFAQRLIRVTGSAAVLDAYSTHYWRLRNWLAPFRTQNAVPYIIQHPLEFRRTHWMYRALGVLPAWILHALTPFSPGFVFVLRKPKS
jgi:ubiquinone/menaquinone biosynthesis C-methylase UbiE